MKRICLPVLVLAVLLSVVFFSCKKSSSGPAVKSVAYYPLQIGKYVVYNVDSIRWVDTSCLEYNTTYQLRYEIKDTFSDARKNLFYVFYVYKKSNATKQAWVSNDVFYASLSDTGIIVTKDQLRFIKITLPVTSGNAWRGNTLIHTSDTDNAYFNNWSYTYQNVANSFYDGTLSFDKTITVNERDETINNIATLPDTTASRTYFKEIYGEGVGLIYSEATHWTYDPVKASCKKGYSVIMSATDHN
ncbi:MAG: hypothetical protein H0X33_12560 [Taibaiella sp.]|nr:hypothetical protein [Taibaiella sp.]